MLRLDKFLKNSRLIKRRPLAKQVADQGRIKINGNVAKASSVVTPGDEMEIQYGKRLLTVKVKEVKEIVKKDEAEQLYDVIKEERIKED